MASQKERQRWELWFEQVTKRMAAQRKSLTRLTLLLTEALAALHEIAAMEDPEDMPSDSRCQDRARLAIERIEGPSAAITDEARELTEAEEVEDPRRG